MGTAIQSAPTGGPSKSGFCIGRTSWTDMETAAAIKTMLAIRGK